VQEFSRASGLADAYFNATIPIATQPAWPLAAYAKYSYQSGLDGQLTSRRSEATSALIADACSYACTCVDAA
jgi:hypothetical protein